MAPNTQSRSTVNEPSALDRDPAAVYADFICATTPTAVPRAILDRARHHVLDAVGIALASGKHDFAHRALSAARILAGRGDELVPVIGFPIRLPLRDAALINGLLCHGLDFDDTHTAGVVHPTASVFPTALSAGIKVNASIGDVMVAYVLGVEVIARVASAVRGGFHRAGFHPTGVAGVFGCALVAGRLWGLPSRELVHAQGIALSFASGSMEFLDSGAWTKRLHPGWAAQAGLTAAGLAKQGVTGPQSPYCGRFGLFQIYLGGDAGKYDIELATKDLGSEWELLNTAIKSYPVCHLAHGAIDAALGLHASIVGTPDDIKRIEVLLPAATISIICEPADKKRRPQGDYEARFSIQYLVAAALLRGRITLTELEPDSLTDPAILRLAERVEYVIDESSSFPRAYSGEVVLHMYDGRQQRNREEVHRGAAEHPITADEIVAKFHRNAAMATNMQTAVAIREAVLHYDLKSPISAMAAALGCNPA
jgi:2-methylcitrate dehydratase PrpD